MDRYLTGCLVIQLNGLFFETYSLFLSQILLVSHYLIGTNKTICFIFFSKPSYHLQLYFLEYTLVR